MRASGQKLVKFCTLTHTLTHAAKLVVRICNLWWTPLEGQIFINTTPVLALEWSDWIIRTRNYNIVGPCSTVRSYYS